MSLESAIAGRSALLSTIGKAALNAKYPKEFELYVIALELTDENFNTLRYFVFPVNPSSIEENKPKLTNVKKTLAGVTVLSTTTFIPTDITLSGNFGRKFKVLLGSTYEDFIASFKIFTQKNPNGIITSDSLQNGVVQIFDERVKTGYGCTKILEEIVTLADTVDEFGGIRKLIFHNPALGNSYLVKPINLRLNQNEQTNMIWNYSLQLKSIAPLESLRTKEELESISIQLAKTAYAQKKVDQLLNGLARIGEKTITAAFNVNDKLVDKIIQ
jgi:hypothetical protein